ncbi:MAG TPA: biotin synthase BioB [Desulfobulbaceae bacterium]|nr:biotin synthase BioB [Desulfobulbaceae bacterium]
MHNLLAQTYDRLHGGKCLSRADALQLSRIPDPGAFFALADTIRRDFMGNRFHLCSIINARSGNCSEDCRFCAQSRRHTTEVAAYEVIAKEQALKQAKNSDQHGVRRLSLVTSGRRLTDAQLEEMRPLYAAIAGETSLALCASMGLLDGDGLQRLKKMGVSRYHCNLETSASFFPRVCTTHSHRQKAQTLKQAERVGLSLCSGGIIGMGESMEDRIDLAFELRELGVKSIPINILTPIAGTPLADQSALPLQEVLMTVALFRLINPDAVIRMAGGRQQLGRDQYRCFTAGANGAIVGNFLTTVGSGIKDDLHAFTDLGFVVSGE